VNRIEDLATPRIEAVVERQFEMLDLAPRLYIIDLHVADGHPGGGRSTFVTSTLRLTGTLVVRCILDTTWYEAVWRRQLVIIDDHFVLDIDGDRIAYVNWEARRLLSGAFPYAEVRYAELHNDGEHAHLGERILGPASDRGAEFLVEWQRR
jgi:hypothetical protein